MRHHPQLKKGGKAGHRHCEAGQRLKGTQAKQPADRGQKSTDNWIGNKTYECAQSECCEARQCGSGDNGRNKDRSRDGKRRLLAGSELAMLLVSAAVMNAISAAILFCEKAIAPG
jgi:hypothetical protein